jgi:hypothetical protein
MNSGSTLYRYLLGGIGGATRRSYPACDVRSHALSGYVDWRVSRC